MKQFSEVVMDHFTSPRNMGEVPAPHGVGTSDVAAGGQFIRIQVVLDGKCVAKAKFQTIGCVPAIACASWLTEWAQGRPVQEILRLTPEQLIEGLHGLPPDKFFCAQLAVDAMQGALRNASSATADSRKTVVAT